MPTVRRITDEEKRQVKEFRRTHEDWSYQRVGKQFGISEAAVRKILGVGVYGPGGARVGKKARAPSSVDLRELVEALEDRATALLADIQELKKAAEVLAAFDKALANASALTDEVERTKQEADRLRAAMVQRAMAVHSDPRD